ncbi:hypothetical protein BIV02_04540 [Curtobacterium sp. MMLR14_014]|uniref:phosphocholine cytidylyltransferase family protein n=1 Tax=unclassified Curtobacterium TaxID=257496 RepID=UPI0008F89EC8|nr:MULTISPECIES: NTP transferase domain-containing protein [unclassified Curtobacterium]OII37710.1 hypothetical protein BIU91_11640 [Curtobacterium sp. MMLR14_002]OII42683.1 hypothetical protein BIV02_04540 [Curtobacterium sp. MMLR14_014]
MSGTSALFLCAGSGTRAVDVTSDLPKCLLQIGGVRLIDRARAQLDACGVGHVAVIAGFKWQELTKALDGHAEVRVWNGWQDANNLWTLGANADLLTAGGGGRVILFGDVIFDDGLIADVLASTADIALAVDTTSRLSGTMRVRMREQRFEIGNEVPPDDADGNFVGVLKLSEQACAAVAAEAAQRFNDRRNRLDYYTAVLPIAASHLSVECVPVGRNRWAEVDTPEDYTRARSIFERAYEKETSCAE